MMKEIKIRIPEECGSECICFKEATTKDGTSIPLCLAFDRILSKGCIVIYRCDECIKAISEAEGENE